MTLAHKINSSVQKSGSPLRDPHRIHPPLPLARGRQQHDDQFAALLAHSRTQTGPGLRSDPCLDPVEAPLEHLISVFPSDPAEGEPIGPEEHRLVGPGADYQTENLALHGGRG